MDKTAKVIFMCFICLVATTAFGYAGTLEDLDRSAKEMERSIKYRQLRDLEYQRKYQLPQQSLETFTSPLTPQIQKTDKAVTRNQERFKKMMDEQKKSLSQVVDGWGFKIPKEHRLVVELIAIFLFISFFSFIFYRQNVRRREEEKQEGNTN